MILRANSLIQDYTISELAISVVFAVAVVCCSLPMRLPWCPLLACPCSVARCAVEVSAPSPLLFFLSLFIVNIIEAFLPLSRGATPCTLGTLLPVVLTPRVGASKSV